LCTSSTNPELREKSVFLFFRSCEGDLDNTPVVRQLYLISQKILPGIKITSKDKAIDFSLEKQANL